MLNAYYEILGVSSNATLSEIKRAFRIRAKELHPDVNKSPNAHEQFILLLEAYEYLINLKTDKVYTKNSTEDRTYTSYQRWQDSEAARARHRAEYFSKVKYKEFENSNYFKTVTSLNTIFEHLGFFIAVIVFIPLPVILTLIYGLNGFIISLLAIFITLPLMRSAIRSWSSINIPEFFKAVAFVTKTRNASVVALTIFNLFIILKVGFQTLIPFSSLILIFILSMSVFYFLTRFDLKKSQRSSAVISFCYCPFVLNLLFVVNFLFSANPGWETYSFTPKENNAEGKLAYINLENNRYRDFDGIRVFADYNELKGKNKIAYKFEEGLFGFRVMKDFKFYK
jgi:curved DNA-binding protein CbpA